jgi:hypothetical protein
LIATEPGLWVKGLEEFLQVQDLTRIKGAEAIDQIGELSHITWPRVASHRIQEIYTKFDGAVLNIGKLL